MNRDAPEQERDASTLLERAGTAAAGIGELGSGNPRRRLLIQYGLVALIFAFLLLFVARQWNELPDFDWHFAPGWLALSAACLTSFYALQCELWQWILRSLTPNALPAPTARAVWGKSLLARYVPTNALMVVGRAVMAERYGVPKRMTLVSIVYELGLTFGVAVMLGAYFVIDLPDLQDQPARYVVLGLIPIVLAGLHPRIFLPLANWALGKLGREPVPQPLPFSAILKGAIGYAGTWAVAGLGVYAFAAALHPVDSGDLLYIAASYPVAYCVAVLTFIVPSGLGTRDATLATAMSAVLPGAVATAIAVALRIFQTAVELLWVAAMVAIEKRRRPPVE